MQPLHPNATERIALNIPHQPEIEFHRVGSIGDGKCLLHSILFLMHDEYPSLPPESRIQLVQSFLSQITQHLSRDAWFQFGGEYDVIMHVRKELEQSFDEKLLDKLFQSIENKGNFQDFINRACTQIARYSRRQERYALYFRNRIPEIADEFFQNYLNSLQNCRDLGVNEVRFISDLYRLNILLFDATGNPFYENRVNSNYSQMILLFNQGGCHWESVVVRIKGVNYRQIPTGSLQS